MFRLSRTGIGLVVACVAAAPVHALSLDELEGRVFPSAAEAERRADLAAVERELSATGTFAREGAEISMDAGARRDAGGATLGDFAARVDLPVGGLKAERGRLEEASHGSAAVLDVETRGALLELRLAYFDAWLGQERLAVLEQQRRDTERLLEVVRRRVEAGAEAPYESALVEGDLVRQHVELDAARKELGLAWRAMRRLAPLGPSPEPLDPPRVPAAFPGGGEVPVSFAARRSIAEALADLDAARAGSRWTVAAAAAREGEESVATVGAAYRFALRGEAAARERERAALRDAARRNAEADAAELETRLRSALDRARDFGPIPEPASFDAAIVAIQARIETGKESPSRALPVRRQLLDARAAALERRRDAMALEAEIRFFDAGVTP